MKIALKFMNIMLWSLLEGESREMWRRFFKNKSNLFRIKLRIQAVKLLKNYIFNKQLKFEFFLIALIYAGLRLTKET